MHLGIEALVISLATSLARREMVRANLADLKLKWSFLEGRRVDSECPIEPNVDRQISRFGRRMTDAEVGCFKSHYSALQKFNEDEDLQWLMVMEDDVWLDLDFDIPQLTRVMEEKQIPYMRLYCRSWKTADQIMEFGERAIVRFRSDPYGTQAYLINREAATRFTSLMKSIDMPIDDELGRFWIHRMDILAVFPFPVIERNIPSIILPERLMNPMRTKDYTFARHVDRIHNYVLKLFANLKFFVRGYKPFSQKTPRP